MGLLTLIRSSRSPRYKVRVHGLGRYSEETFGTLAQARSYADAWGSTFVDVGAVGHINSASNLGTWPAGHALLESLRRGAHRDASP